MILKRLEPMSVAKIYGVICVFIGFLVGVVSAAVGWFARSVFESAGAAAGPSPFSEGFGYLFGTGAILSFPIFYGIMGFVFGYLGAAIYNWIAGHIGGIEMEFE